MDGKLKYLSAENFQGYTNVGVKLNPGITAIIGESDAGKTSLIRLIKWMMTGRPLGDGLKNFRAKTNAEIKGELVFDDVTVQKIKSKSRNEYSVDKNTFAAVGTDVPDKVVEAINLNEINLQSQHDTYFLLQETGGNAAKKLNELVGLDILDHVLGKTNSEIRTNKRKSEELKQEILDLKKDLAEFRRLGTVEAIVKKIEASIAVFNKKLHDIETIGVACVAVQKTSADLENVTAWLEVEDYYTKIMILFSKLEKSVANVSNTKPLTESIREVQMEIEEHDAVLLPEEKVDTIILKAERLDNRISNLTKVTSAIKSITFTSVGIERADAQVKKGLATLKTLLEKEKLCPICGSAISKIDPRRLL